MVLMCYKYPGKDNVNNGQWLAHMRNLIFLSYVPSRSWPRWLAAAAPSGRSRGSVRRLCFEADRFPPRSGSSLQACKHNNTHNQTQAILDAIFIAAILRGPWWGPVDLNVYLHVHVEELSDLCVLSNWIVYGELARVLFRTFFLRRRGGGRQK